MAVGPHFFPTLRLTVQSPLVNLNQAEGTSEEGNLLGHKVGHQLIVCLTQMSSHEEGSKGCSTPNKIMRKATAKISKKSNPQQNIINWNLIVEKLL